jgi:hypothetical protein
VDDRTDPSSGVQPKEKDGTMAKPQGTTSSQSGNASGMKERDGSTNSKPQQSTATAAGENSDGQAMSLGDVQQQASKLVSTAREQATGQAASQKAQLASTLGVLAGALQQAGQQVREQQDGPVADYVDAAAGQIAHLSTMLEEQDFAQLLQTVKQVGQRQPGLFLAGAIALGFAGVRFLKSGSETSNGSGESRSGQAWTGSTSPDEGGYQGRYWDSTIGPDWQSNRASPSAADRMVEQTWSGDYAGAVGAEPR